MSYKVISNVKDALFTWIKVDINMEDIFQVYLGFKFSKCVSSILTVFHTVKIVRYLIFEKIFCISVGLMLFAWEFLFIKQSM